MTNGHAQQYYREVGAAVLRQVAWIEVVVADVDARALGNRTLTDQQDLDELTAAGGVGLSALTAGLAARSTAATGASGGSWVAWWIAPGAGADIAVAATAALALSEEPAAGGARWVPMTDGSDGLVLVAIMPRTDEVVDPAEFAAGAARRLAGRAPEIATTDPEAADGRAYLDVRPSAPTGTIPIAYSLVPPGTHRAVVPLTLDELAAITAGMPATFTPDDVPDRLARHGDLAAALAPPTSR